MKNVEKIRNFVREQYIRPARVRRDVTVTVNAGEIAKAMGEGITVKTVVKALGEEKVECILGVKKVGDINPNHAHDEHYSFIYEVSPEIGIGSVTIYGDEPESAKFAKFEKMVHDLADRVHQKGDRDRPLREHILELPVNLKTNPADAGNKFRKIIETLVYSVYWNEHQRQAKRGETFVLVEEMIGSGEIPLKIGQYCKAVTGVTNPTSHGTMDPIGYDFTTDDAMAVYHLVERIVDWYLRKY